jgi:hypothetical protein
VYHWNESIKTTILLPLTSSQVIHFILPSILPSLKYNASSCMHRINSVVSAITPSFDQSSTSLNTVRSSQSVFFGHQFISYHFVHMSCQSINQSHSLSLKSQSLVNVMCMYASLLCLLLLKLQYNILLINSQSNQRTIIPTQQR